jgi:hypothetical protein
MVEGLFEKFRIELNRVEWRIGLYPSVLGCEKIRADRKIQEKEEFINSLVCEGVLKERRGSFVTVL